MDGLKKTAIDIINKHINSGTKITVSFKHNIFRFYNDWSGQRDHFLTHDLGNKKLNTKVKNEFGEYKVLRKLTFENDIDIAKEYAVLGSFSFNKVEESEIIIIYKSGEVLICTDYFEIKIKFSEKLILDSNSIKNLSEKRLKEYFDDRVKSMGYSDRLNLIEDLKKDD